MGRFYHRSFSTACAVSSVQLGLLFSQGAPAEIDDNLNLMSDVWEAAHGAPLIASEDTDFDGFSNLAESRAGTNPRDANSYPKITEVVVGNDDSITVRWPGIPGIRYQSHVSTDLTTWSPVGPEVTGTGTEKEIVLIPAATYTTGGVQHSRWVNSDSGISYNTLLGYVESGTTPPTLEDRLQRLQIPQSDPDLNSYGQWIRGYIIAPETGAYTFQITGDDRTEFYLSTDRNRANKSLAASITGWTGANEWDKYPTQTSTAISLTAGDTYYFEILHVEGSGGDHFTVAWRRPSMAEGTREVIGSPHLSSTGESLADLQAAGKSLFFKMENSQKDADKDGVSDFEESLLGLNMSTRTSTPRVEDGVAARQILASPSNVTLGVSAPRAYEAGGLPGEFVVFRSGGIAPLTVPYTVSGSAIPGVDYETLSGQISIPGAARSARIVIRPLLDGIVETPENVSLTLLPGAAYQLGSPANASLTIDDAEDVLYVAQLRPSDTSASGGSGTASVRRTGNSLTGRTSLTFTALAGNFSSAEIFLTPTGPGIEGVYTFPAGLSSGNTWDFTAAGGFTREEILNALDSGSLWVRIETDAPDSPEIFGQLLPTPSWQTMPAVTTPPVAPSLSEDTGDAARFLTQATFGPSPADLTTLEATTFASWVDTQLALSPTFHHPGMMARRNQLITRGDTNGGWQGPRNEAWWQAALTAPDQLRQRMAFSLSQILVISQFGALDGEHEGTTLYYDTLLEHSFGNYRDLLEEVTLSPMMGTYLSMVRNRKPDPETGHEPDENYAREVMQLFSVGLNMMHTDGSLMLDSEGMPIPTYTQDDIVGLAHIFTGWGPHYDPANPPLWSDGNVADRNGWFLYGRDPLRKMSFYPEFHDNEDRNILGGVTVPAGADGEARLQLALDTLFNHPNVGPFLARQLIQKFVTSNPSPGYIHRVASIFNDDGTGTRGNLGATIKAVILDYEARSPAVRNSVSFGKPSEPLLRYTRMIRALPGKLPNAANGDPNYYFNLQYSLPEQGPLLSPSVFNFFQPVYSNPGLIARAGLLSPEFQIFGETNAIRQANLTFAFVYWGMGVSERDPVTNDNYSFEIDYAPLVAILNTPGLTPAQAQDRLIDYLDDRFFFGEMSTSLRAEILQAFADLPSWFDFTEERQAQRAQAALYLVLNSPEFFVQN